MTALTLERGGDVIDRGPNGRTPVNTLAQRNPNPAVVEIMLADGADIDARNNRGVTPLHPLCGHPRASTSFSSQ